MTIKRDVRDDSQALLMCQAIEGADGSVISVVHTPGHTTSKGFDVPSRWHVFAWVADDIQAAKVDRAYAAALEASHG